MPQTLPKKNENNKIGKMNQQINDEIKRKQDYQSTRHLMQAFGSRSNKSDSI